MDLIIYKGGLCFAECISIKCSKSVLSCTRVFVSLCPLHVPVCKCSGHRLIGLSQTYEGHRLSRQEVGHHRLVALATAGQNSLNGLSHQKQQVQKAYLFCRSHGCITLSWSLCAAASDNEILHF